MSILSWLFGACANHDNVVSVDALTFAKAIRSERVQLIDVRTEAEFAEAKIEYARNVDVLQPAFMERVRPLLDKNKKVYVYCRSGKRSMTAAKQLASEGFKVVNLKGGIMEWQQTNP
ncbi:MAG TPA: rhodanese-like domain-containing protein [Prevotella sp.]